LKSYKEHGVILTDRPKPKRLVVTHEAAPERDSRLQSESYVASTVKAMPPSGIRKFFDLVNEMEGAISLGWASRTS